MRWSWIAVVVLGLMVMGLGASAQASDLESQVKKLQEQIEKQQAQLEALQEALQSESRERKASLTEIKSLQLQTDRIKIGGDIRLRGVSFHDVWDMGSAAPGLRDSNDSWDFYRFRNRLWFDVNLGESELAEEMRGYIRLVNEYHWGDSNDTIYYANAYSSAMDGEVNSRKQIEIDNAYIELKYIANTCVSLKIGRQDLVYGEGFLVLDGTPWDGSRTIGFDAIKFSLDFDHTVVDIFTAKLFENNRGLGDDENLFGVYATNKELLDGHTIEAYVLHQDNNGVRYTGHPVAGRGKVVPSFNVTAVGTRLSGKLTDNLKYAGEIAGQWGSNNSASHPIGGTVEGSSDSAVGGYLNATYCMNDLALKPELTGGFTYLGEGWKSMYGDWPKYSELLIYTIYDGFDFFKPTNTDPTLGTWSNMMFPSVAVTVKPTAKMSASLGYRYLLSVKDRGDAPNQIMFDSNGSRVDGDNIGSLVQGMVKYQFTKNLSSHALIEYFNPGDYYPDYFNDAYFARWELMLSF